jgi:uncharacterized protein
MEAKSTKHETILATVEAWVRGRLDASGGIAHGWLHTERVRQHIRVLAPAEGVDPFLAELAALLHDVGRAVPGPEAEHGARAADMAQALLEELPLTDDQRESVLHAIRWHNSQRADTPLLCVLRDADMLDGMGAIGIMRAFMSKSHLPAYDPAYPFQANGRPGPPATCSDQILAQRRWPAFLNTDTARELAGARVAFMDTFLAQAQREMPTDDGRKTENQ